MSIIFDENKDDLFQGNAYPVLNLKTTEDFNFKKVQQAVRNLLEKNKQNQTIIVRPDCENTYLMLFAALTNLEKSENMCRVVFKVENYKEALERYKPFFTFTSVADYAFRLLDMNKTEMYKDIRSLSYLNLDVSTDYVKEVMTLQLSGTGKKRTFYVSDLENTVILASLIKMLSIIKPDDWDINISITLKMITHDIKQIINKDKILQKLYWCVKPFLEDNK